MSFPTTLPILTIPKVESNMTVTIKNLTPLRLKELTTGDKITIRYASSPREVENGGSRIIREGFPKNVATAFSAKWADLFPAVNKMTVGQLSGPKRTAISLVGDTEDRVKQVLDWMIACCDGKGMKDFKIGDDKPFFNCHLIRETAEFLGVAILSEQMTARMQAMAAHQIHSEDARAMYRLLPRGHSMLKFVAEHVANKIWERRLQAAGPYRTLREEIPAFDKDINEVLDPMVAKRKQERQERWKQEHAEAAAGQEGKVSIKARQMMNTVRKDGFDTGAVAGGHADRPSHRGGRGGGWTRGHQPNYHYRAARYKNYNTSTHHGPQRQQDVQTLASTRQEQQYHQHKTLRCPVARKATGGRPAYVSLSLADIGVSKDRFTGRVLQEQA